MPTRYWIGVASREHVMQGVAGGFCQLGHGKSAPVKRLAPGDWIAYYSPRTRIDGGEPVQAFTAIGRIKAGEPYEADMGGGFHPVRRDVDYRKAAEAPIRPLLDRLSFTSGRQSWGYAFRRGSFTILVEDFLMIAEAMGVRDDIAAEVARQGAERLT
jgi:EVE domain